MLAYDKLAWPVRKWIRSQGWADLRDIQTQAIHAIKDSHDDVLIAASTAAGKTEAAFLPLISEVYETEKEGEGFDLLYIAPLKALISDQASRLEAICQEAEIPVVPWHGDISSSVKIRARKHPSGILMITPESLEAMFMRNGSDIPRLFHSVRAAILDEVHTMLDSERGIQLQSLLSRLEIAIQRPIRRVGISATLGDMKQACRYLQPDNPDNVQILKSDSGSPELRLQLRGYVRGDKDAAEKNISQHLFMHLRGSNNLIFAGSRQNVEIYADKLRRLCEKQNLPQEFYPHHASLSRDHRFALERRLKQSQLPTTAICTSTLELGVDIGDVNCVAQIGAPFSVASLRQRLGRSGRRAGQAAILRQYVIEDELDSQSNFSSQLRLGLIRSIAMIDLLLEKWCEPAHSDALHLSTLVHQILSVIVEKGGIDKRRLYFILCKRGSFRQISTAVFSDLLRAMACSESQLIEHADNGLLLLGAQGESLVSHYSFYAVFQTPEEYRIVFDSKTLGTLPINNMIAPEMMLIFSGRRWLVKEVDDQGKTIVVIPSNAGKPPKFGGDIGNIHDIVAERMFSILEQPDYQPIYLDSIAANFLQEARSNFAQIFAHARIVEMGDHYWIVATCCGTIKTTTLAFALRNQGYHVEIYDGFLEVKGNDKISPLPDFLREIADGNPCNLMISDANLNREKFHPYLTEKLLEMDALSSRVDEKSLPAVAQSILSDRAIVKA